MVFLYFLFYLFNYLLILFVFCVVVVFVTFPRGISNENRTREFPVSSGFNERQKLFLLTSLQAEAMTQFHAYRISSNKHRTSSKRCPLISAATSGIHIELSASL